MKLCKQMKFYNTLREIKKTSVVNPDISICIRVKNESVFIEDFLKSLALQDSIHKIEVIIVDSGSTDDTLTILMQYDVSIYEISPLEFSFGDSCNLIINLSSADIIYMFSGHVQLIDFNLISKSYYYLVVPAKPLQPA